MGRPSSANKASGLEVRSTKPDHAISGGGDLAARAMSPSWAEVLTALHRNVRLAVVGSVLQPTGAINPKGDEVWTFDLEAQAAAVASIEAALGSAVLESEESGRLTIGEGAARHRLVLDPVDGSDNWARSLPLSTISCAVLPLDGGFHPDRVEWAVVGPLDEESPLIAQKEAGAWRGDKRLKTSRTDSIRDAVISCELNHFSPPPGLCGVMASARGVRSYGCASAALTLVASGAIDAHIDIRDRLTPESYLAAARLVIEAGGVVVAPDGGPLPTVEKLTDRVSLIATANEILCDEIAARLRDDSG